MSRSDGLRSKAKGVEVNLKMLRRLSRKRALSISKGPDEDRIEGLACISHAELEILIMEPASALVGSVKYEGEIPETLTG